jgi:hypothetical protein
MKAEGFSPMGYRMLGAAGVALCIVGLCTAFAWSGMKSAECHEGINIVKMNQWNMTLPSDGKTICDRGDDMSTKVWWISSCCGLLGIIFSYKGLKRGSQ